ncbi:MAG: preprotein translocase subunit YidC [Ignavibacteria bacterium]|nr:MAG: preprotein translocase subunit YidC [Ignavibacteria bacterium]KAF0160513.1 MAG: preprotein translocase subunit YidC [Ignavibacteria bacterium]
MDRNSTLAFLLIGVILVIWLYWNSPAPEPPKPQTPTTVEQKDTVKQTVPASAQEQKQEEATPFGASNLSEKIVTIETELSIIELTSKGGKIRRVFLKKYNTWYYSKDKDTTFYKKYVQLVNTSRNGGDFNIIFVTKDGKLVNTSSLDFIADKTKSHYKIAGKDSLEIEYVFSGENGKKIKKSFKFFANKYDSKVDIALENMEDVISSFRYDVVWQNGLNFVEDNSVDEALYSHANVFAGEENVVVDASSVGEKVNKDINGKIDWVGVRNKYFAAIIAPHNATSDGGAYVEGTHFVNKYGSREVYSASVKVPFKNQKYQKDSFTLYVGPIDYYLLKEYNNNFESIFEFGNFLGLKFIIRPISEYLMLPLLRFLDGFIPNYGLVIIIFTIIIKIALAPLTKSSLKSMAKMQKLQPMITELKEKYKDNQQKQQQETMKLYQTYGINPMGGCLPMLLQMPILVALWSLFNVAIDIRQQPFMLWITNLSSPDIIFKLPFKIPFFNLDIVSGLALLMGITMFIQQKMSIKDPAQKALIYIMPIMFTVMFMSMPSGLNLYYFVFNLLGIAQQYYVTHKSNGEELVPVVVNPNKKKGFMSRMMEAAEKQAQMQKKAKKK